jgi:hypothetical protein
MRSDSDERRRDKLRDEIALARIESDDASTDPIMVR